MGKMQWKSSVVPGRFSRISITCRRGSWGPIECAPGITVRAVTTRPCHGPLTANPPATPSTCEARAGVGENQWSMSRFT